MKIVVFINFVCFCLLFQNISANPPDESLQSKTFHTVNRGERVEFVCSNGHNATLKQWRRVDGKAIPASAKITSNRLMIDQVSDDDAGSYECFFCNEYRSDPKVLLTSQLAVVAGPPKKPFSTLTPINVKSGEDFIVYCNAISESPMNK